MVIELNPSDPEFAYETPEGVVHANLLFASASSPDAATIEVYLNDALVDKVYLHVPHSWWMPSQKLGKDSYQPGDKLMLRAVGGTVAFRLDLEEHRAEG